MTSTAPPPSLKPTPGRPGLLVAEDDPVYGAWAVQVLQAACPPGDVVWCQTLAEAQDTVNHRPGYWSLAVIDLNLEHDDGTRLVQWLAEREPDLPSLVLTAVDSPSRALQAMRSGALGYVLKATDAHLLQDVAAQVLSGGSPLSPRIARLLLSEFRDEPANPSASSSSRPSALDQWSLRLTQRENEVLALLARGYTQKESARMLSLSPATVDTHVRSIYRKLAVNSRAELRRLIAA